MLSKLSIQIQKLRQDSRATRTFRLIFDLIVSIEKTASKKPKKITIRQIISTILHGS